MHRLWYDLRTQAMFDPALREAVLAIDATLEEMIWRVLSRYAELSGGTLAVTSGNAYAMLDGLFERALLRHLAGDDARPRRAAGDRARRALDAARLSSAGPHHVGLRGLVVDRLLVGVPQRPEVVEQRVDPGDRADERDHAEQAGTPLGRASGRARCRAASGRAGRAAAP